MNKPKKHNVLQRTYFSLKNRGLIGSIDNSITIIEDSLFDRKYGTETSVLVELDSLDIKSENKNLGHKYQPTRARDFKKMLDSVSFPNNSVLVDFGCGKGRTLLLACPYSFKRIVGVEFSKELCTIAKSNIRSYKKKLGNNKNCDVEIIYSDSTEYEIRDDENVFYLFNPFKGKLMEKVIDNICCSLKNHHRKIWIIYYGGYDNRKIIEKKRDVSFNFREYALSRNDKFIVYTNKG